MDNRTFPLQEADKHRFQSDARCVKRGGRKSVEIKVKEIEMDRKRPRLSTVIIIGKNKDDEKRMKGAKKEGSRGKTQASAADSDAY